MKNYCRSREKLEGRLSRRKTYHCTECGKEIHADTLHPIPKIDMVCPECRMSTGVYTFVNKRSGKDVLVRAHDAELATLRAREISPTLTFKVTQETTNANT